MMNDPLLLAMLGTGFTFAATALGAAVVFLAPNRQDKNPQFNWGWIKNTLVKRKNLLC